MKRRQEKTRAAAEAPSRFHTALGPHVREIKCPQCKAFALYIAESGGETVVRCRKCGFDERLGVFAAGNMGFHVREGRAFVRYPDAFGEMKDHVLECSEGG